MPAGLQQVCWFVCVFGLGGDCVFVCELLRYRCCVVLLGGDKKKRKRNCSIFLLVNWPFHSCGANYYLPMKEIVTKKKKENAKRTAMRMQIDNAKE